MVMVLNSAYTGGPLPRYASSGSSGAPCRPLALGRTSMFGGVNLCSSSALPASLARSPLTPMVGAARGRVRYGVLEATSGLGE